MLSCNSSGKSATPINMKLNTTMEDIKCPPLNTYQDVSV